MPKLPGKGWYLGCFLIAILIAFSLQSTTAAAVDTGDPHQNGGRPKYVFLFIGDGMGVAHRELVEQYLTDRNFDPAAGFRSEKLLMNQFSVGGFTDTDNYQDQLTDSAAAGTAIATGQKTANGVISMAADQSTPYKTIAEIAQSNEWKVGIITSVSLNHATPATFYSHTSSRVDLEGIWKQLLASQFDYFAGGGVDLPRGQFARFAHKAGDSGYTITQSRQEFLAISSETGKVIAINPVLDAHMEMPYAVDAGSDSLTLADFTRKGIEVLNNETGFFMLIEGGRIDYASHANDTTRMVGEVLAFDAAIAQAFEFYLEHPAETLIVVTADHETGGILWIAPRRGGEMRILPDVYQSWVDVTPLRIRDNSSHGYSSDEAGSTSLKSALADTVLLPDYGDSIASIGESSLDMVWTSETHTRSQVLTTALGVGAETFAGSYENTEIFWKLLELTGLE